MKFKRLHVWAALLAVCSLSLVALFWSQKKSEEHARTQSDVDSSTGSGINANGNGAPIALPPKRAGASEVPSAPVAGSGPALTPEQISALDEAAAAKVQAERVAFQQKLEALFQGQRPIMLKQRSGEYRLVPGVYALSGERLNSLNDYEIVEKRARDFLVQLAAGSTVPVEAQSVVYSAVRHTLGSITGTVSVVLKPGVDATEVARAFNLELVRSFPAQKMAFFRGQSNRLEDLIPIVNKISQSPSVASAELEIRERVYVVQ